MKPSSPFPTYNLVNYNVASGSETHTCHSTMPSVSVNVFPLHRTVENKLQKTQEFKIRALDTDNDRLC
jgi:hypothetical protein